MFIIACSKPTRDPVSQILFKDEVVAYTFFENGKYGLLDSSLKIILPPKYNYIFDYQNYGVIKTDNGGKKIDGGDYLHYETDSIGLIDIKGKILFEPQFDEIIISFGTARVKKGERYGYVDLDGNFLINPKFKQAWFVENGVATVKEDSLWGIVKTSGEYLIPPTFLYLSKFSDGIAYFEKDQKGYYGYINTSGQVLIDNLNGVGTFRHGFAPIYLNQKWGVIDKSGKIVVKPRFPKSINFMEFESEIWITQYDEEKREWLKIEKLKS